MIRHSSVSPAITKENTHAPYVVKKVHGARKKGKKVVRVKKARR